MIIEQIEGLIAELREMNIEGMVAFYIERAIENLEISLEEARNNSDVKRRDVAKVS